uniref:Disks large-associated protein 5 n=1 Tax=Strongyloides venezuelensis TaxID=75913 RepID=A0A0K0F843_STRVS
MSDTNAPKSGLMKSINFFRFRTPKKDLDDTPLRFGKGSRLNDNDTSKDSLTLETPCLDSPVARFFKKVRPKRLETSRKLVDKAPTSIETDDKNEKSTNQDDQFDLSNVTIRNQQVPTYVSVSVALNGYHIPSQKCGPLVDNSEQNGRNLQSASQEYVTNIEIEAVDDQQEIPAKFSVKWNTVSSETPEAYRDLADTSISLINDRKMLANLLISEKKDIMCDDAHTTFIQVNGHGDMITKNIGKLYKYIDNCLEGVQGYGEATTVNDLSSFWHGVIQPELDKYSKILEKADKYRDNNYKEILHEEETVTVIKKIKPKITISKQNTVESEKVKQQKAAREEQRKKFLQEMKKKAASSRNKDISSENVIY